MKVVAITVGAKDSAEEGTTYVLADHFLAAIDQRGATANDNTVDVKLTGGLSFTLYGTLLTVTTQELEDKSS